MTSLRCFDLQAGRRGCSESMGGVESGSEQRTEEVEAHDGKRQEGFRT